MRTILVAGSSSDAGKTTLACRIVQVLPGWGALKISTVRPHPCDGAPDCPACHGLRAPFRVSTAPQEIRAPGSDTERLHRAGAARVAWLVAREEALGEGIVRALEAMGGLPGVVIEGNSFARHRRPDRLVLVVRGDGAPPKPSAEALRSLADRVLVNRGTGSAAQDEAETLRLLEEIRTWFPG